MFYPYKSSLTSPDNNDQAAFIIGAEITSAQTQSGNDSKAHLAGENFPLFGKLLQISGSDIPNITMKQLASIVEVEVSNELEDEISVRGIDFVANDDIVGQFYIGHSEEGVSYTAISEAVSKTAKLSVEEAAFLKKSEKGRFYLGVKPFTAMSGSDITVIVRTSSSKGEGSHTKTFNLNKNFTFSAGKIKTVKVKYDTPFTKEEILWKETWDTGKRNELPSEYSQGSTVVYGNNTVTYSESGGTKLYTKISSLSSVNLLLGAGSTFTASGIPAAGAKSAVLTFISNHNVPAEYQISSTSTITIEEAVISGMEAPYTITVKIGIPDGTGKFGLQFTNSTSTNVRIDEISLVGTVSGGGGTEPGGGSGSGGEQPGGSLPYASVSTDATASGSSSAILRGSFGEAVSSPVKIGFKYGTEQGNPDREVLITSIPSGTSGSFSTSISGLSAETTYYYQAFVEVAGTGEHVSQSALFFGEVKEFTTSQEVPAGNSDLPALNHSWLELPARSASMTDPDFYCITNRALFDGVMQRNYSYLYDAGKYASHWVAYPLCEANTIGDRKDQWGPKDPAVPEDKQVSLKNSYGPQQDGLTYDRGHQVPSGDRRNKNQVYMQCQCNYPTNMTPQLYELNRQGWERLEENVRACIPANDTLYVVTGACFNKVGENLEVKEIINQNDGKQIPVPNFYWKVLLKVHREGNTITGASAIGFWLEHKAITKAEVMQYFCSVDDIEQYTGFNFFVNLPAELEVVAERNNDLEAFRGFQ